MKTLVTYAGKVIAQTLLIRSATVSLKDEGKGDFNGLAQRIFPPLYWARRDGARRGGGREGPQAVTPRQDGQAKHVKRIAHEKYIAEIETAHQCGNRGHRLAGRPSLGLEENGGLRDTVLHAIALAHSGLARRISCAPSSGHDQVCRQMPMPQRDRVIQSGAQHGRRSPDVLRRPKHDDRTNRPSLVVLLPVEYGRKRCHPAKKPDSAQCEQQACPERTTRWHHEEASRRSHAARSSGPDESLSLPKAQNRQPKNVKARARVATRRMVQHQPIDEDDGGIAD